MCFSFICFSSVCAYTVWDSYNQVQVELMSCKHLIWEFETDFCQDGNDRKGPSISYTGAEGRFVTFISAKGLKCKQYIVFTSPFSLDVIVLNE